jgi:hypothetical protein
MSSALPIAARLPDLEDWKAQVKCQAGCPVATDAGRYVQLIGEGRDEEAFLVARAPNPFASVCGRVCAAPCEDACRRGAIDAPIAIRALKRHLTERYGVESSRPDTQDSLRQTLISEGNRFAFHLAVALVVWFGAVIFLDLIALGLCTLLPSGLGSRVLIISVLVNPASALRTAELLLLEGTAAFGAASLALLRFTHGPLGAALALGGSLVLWLVLPVLVAIRRLGAADL